jgi:hypothetical protein
MGNNLPIALGYNVTLQAGAIIPLSSLFNWFDADAGDSVTAFAVKDLTIGGGHLIFVPPNDHDGHSPLIDEPDGQLFDNIPISQTGSLPPFWLYQVGSAGASDQIEFAAIDSNGTYSQRAVTTITASTSALPDLSVESINFGSTTLSAGSNIQFGFNWQFSAGSGSNATWTVGAYLSADPILTTDDTFLGNFPSSFTFPPNAGGGASWGLSLPATLAPGTYYIGVVVDNGNRVSESNENNNARAVAITIADTGYVIAPEFAFANESAGTVTFTVTRTGPLPAETLFASTVSSEGYSNSDDYNGLVNQPLDFAAGQSSRTVTVALADDTVVEPDETFALIVQRYADDPITAFLAKSKFTIHDDDASATSYSIAPGSVTVNESAGTATFTVTRSGGLPAETIFASTAQTEGSVNDNDYSGLLNTALTFSSGQTSKDVTISITNDTVAETDETFSLIVQRDAADPVSTFLAKSAFTIHDDDTFTISPASRTVNENAGTATFTVTRPSATNAETVYVSTRQSEGFVNNNDYTALVDQPLSFEPGETSKTVSVPITNDSVGESDETFGFVLLREAGDPAATPLTESTFTILDDDRPATTYSLSPDSTIVNENAGAISFTVTRSGSLPAETVYASTTQTEGYINDFDYGGLANSAVTFAAGQASQTITIAIIDDATIEANETFGLVVQRSASDPVSTSLAKSTFTIHDPDAAQILSSPALDSDASTISVAAAPTPTLRVSNVTVHENDGFATLTLSLSSILPAGKTVPITWHTVDGTARWQDNDYYSTNGTLFFTQPRSGLPTQTIRVELNNDHSPELTENFSIQFDDASRSRATVTIIDDDPAGPPSQPSPNVAFMATLAEAAYHINTKWEVVSNSINEKVSGKNPDGTTKADTYYTQIASQSKLKLLSNTDLSTSDLRSKLAPKVGQGLADGIFIDQNAAALVGVNGDSLYLAFRGTNDNSGGHFLPPSLDPSDPPDVRDWYNEPHHYGLFKDPAANFIGAIDQYLKDHKEIKHVYVTGHSLGGAMAQAFMEDHQDSNGVTFRATTFASIGYTNDGHLGDDRISNISIAGDIAQVIRANFSGTHTRDGDNYIANAKNPPLFPSPALHSVDLYHELAFALNNTIPLSALINGRHNDETFGASIVNVDQDRGQWSVKMTNPFTAFVPAPGTPGVANAISAFTKATESALNPSEWAVSSSLSANSSSISGFGGFFISTSGDDDFSGGDGINVYSTGQTNAPVIVDLSNGRATGDAIGADRLAGIQYVITGFGDDHITGDDFANIIDAGGGNNIVDAKGGDDVIIVGTAGGNGSIDGGAGVDSVVFAGSRDAYAITFLTNSAQVSGTNGVYLLSHVEFLVFDDLTIAVTFPPTITSNGGGDSASVSLAENAAAVTTVAATDPDAGTTLVYSIAGGADAAQFQINPTTGALAFLAAPDFEHPTDADHNNSYIVQVRASDGILFDDQTITVNIGDVNEAPVITSNGGGDTASVSMRENLTFVATIAASDPDAGTALTYSIVGGADAGKFAIDPVTGVLAFILSPDFEHPTDADHDNSYIVQVAASDASLSDTQTLTVIVTDATEPAPAIPAPADFNSDAKSDLLWRNDNGAVALWTMNGAQKAADQVVSPIGNDWHLVDTADFNADGKTDILWRNDTGAVAVWTMNGAQKLADQVVSNMGNDWHFINAADFNADGKADILWRHDNGTVAIWTMNGGQKAADQVVSPIGNDWHLVDTADFNGDGKADILWRNDTGAVAIWTMNGAQKAADQVVSNIGNDWHLIDRADFNGDGKADILWRHDNGTVAIWTMNGAQKAADQVVSNLGNDWHFVDTTDFNGDAKADILLRHDSGAVAIWTMNGGQKAADQVVSNLGNDWQFLGVGDFNADHKADILWRHDTGAVALWTMNGAQKLADQVVSQMGHDWMLA